MAELLWWRGHTTETAAKIVVRSDTDGVITLAGITNDGPKTSASGTNDGIVVFNVSGLSADKGYNFTITHVDGTTSSGSMKTMPESATYSVAYGSCQKENRNLVAGYHIADDPEISAFVHLGDFIYSGSAGTYNGETTISGESDQSTANYNAFHRQGRKSPGMRYLLERKANYYVNDDHEWFGSNWDHTLGNANAFGAGLANQAASDAAFETVNIALTNYMLGNPDNADSGVDPELPDAPAYDTTDAGTTAAAYIPHYFRFTIGDAEFFCLDCISHRSPEDAIDNSSKTMLGSNQKAWLKARLDASTATFKVIFSPKKTYNNATADNGDTFSVYTTERNEILDYIDTDASGNLTGIVWLVGDRHTVSVEAQAKADGETYDHACVCACPISVDINPIQGTHGTTTKLLKPGWNQVFGIVRVVGSTRMELEIRDVYSGDVLWTDYILAGTNYLTHPELQVAI